MGRLFIRVSRAISEPNTRPVFPRTISGTSGFFFWGMMLLPVAKASASVIKPNSDVDQSTNSSDSRLR
jgi:hypothetical protein